MVSSPGGTAAPRSYLAGFGVRMAGQPKRFEEFRVTRRLAPTIGLLAALTPALAHAQTNIDQGKTPAQIFATDCAECHKAARGLASGKNSATLTEFLREHYTTSREQAAALAAYVLGGRGGESGGAAAQGHGQKPAVEHTRAPAEEPKPAKHQARQPGKPEEGTPATVKLQRPADEEAKPEDEASPGEQPSRGTPAARPARGQQPATATRSRRKEPKTPSPSQEPAAVAHVPAAVVAEPGPTETQGTSPMPAAAAPTDAAPTDAASGENAPVARDNIPD